MLRGIPETDWKVFRRLHKIAVERYCERVIDEAGQLIADRSKSSHDRYGELYDLMRRRDKEMARAFDDFRRSTALEQIAIIAALHLWTEAELTEFSAETRAYLYTISQLRL